LGSQPEFALALVLSAAFLHAVWNAMMKRSADRFIAMAMLNFGHGLPALVLVYLFLPPASESWPFLLGSTFVHFFYYIFHLLYYRFGDLSQVYPIARGIAPVCVAMGAWFFAGEILSAQAWWGIILITSGIGVLFISRSKGQANGMAIMAAVATGLMIASYTILDGMGVRASQSAIGYIAWLFLLEWPFSFGLFYYRRKLLRSIPANIYLLGFAGGLISALAYGLAIYAKSIAPLGAVSAVRESSVIIAAMIGVIWFGERPWKLRVLAAIIVAGGVIVLSQA
jgi:drug/metabolite transporter (DMT)-like permease